MDKKSVHSSSFSSPQRADYALDQLEDFCAAVFNHGTRTSSFATRLPSRMFHQDPFHAGSLYCPGCGDFRRMRITLITCVENGEPITQIKDTAQALLHSLYGLSCLQCEATFTSVIYPGVSGPALAILPGILGGMGTPNTPTSVLYYLDQAHKSQAMGAHSAAMAMFRAALDQLMFEQGYTEKGKMLGSKIKQLEEEIASGKGPEWARDLDPSFLRVLNNLGSGSIHPNDGDITKQDAIDAELLGDVQTTFAELLHLVYERKAERNARLTKLRERAELLK